MQLEQAEFSNIQILKFSNLPASFDAEVHVAQRFAGFIAWQRGNTIDDFEPFDHLAEHRHLAFQPGYPTVLEVLSPTAGRQGSAGFFFKIAHTCLGKRKTRHQKELRTVRLPDARPAHRTQRAAQG